MSLECTHYRTKSCHDPRCLFQWNACYGERRHVKLDAGGGLVTGERGAGTQGQGGMYEDVILDPLPPQSRNTPYGRAMLTLASFAGRALSATGLILLIITGGANLGATLLAVLLNRAAPGRALLAFIILGISWFCWLSLAFLRWRLNTAGPGPSVGEDWGLAVPQEEEPSFDGAGRGRDKPAFNQRATSAQDDGETSSSKAPPASSTDTHPEDSPFSQSVGPKEDEQRAMLAEAAERNVRAASEFSTRRNTPFPKVEAAQRSIRILVGGDEQPAWVRFDLRPLVVSFVAVAVSFPVVIITATITMIVLLVSTAPF